MSIGTGLLWSSLNYFIQTSGFRLFGLVTVLALLRLFGITLRSGLRRRLGGSNRSST